MYYNEFTDLVKGLTNRGLSEDQILEIFIQAFETGQCDIDDLELMFSWMGYELKDRFYLDHNIEIPIRTDTEGFKLITRIQDEAHRFAIEYHRSLRSKAQVHSVLDEIPGVGPARRKALLRYFGSIEQISRAELDELKDAESMTEEAAQNVYKFFHKCDKI